MYGLRVMTERNQTIGNAKIQKNCLSIEKKIRMLAKNILEQCSMRKVFFLQFDYFV